MDHWSGLMSRSPFRRFQYRLIVHSTASGCASAVLKFSHHRRLASHVQEKLVVSKSCGAMGRGSAMVVPSLRRWFRQNIHPGLFRQHAKDSGCRG